MGERETPQPAPLNDAAAAAAYEDEKPARQLSGWVGHVVAAGCVLLGLSAVYQVFFPLAQGNQFALILFLAAVLPLTLLSYRSGLALPARWRRDRSPNRETEPRRDSPSPLDWVLAVVALVACLYPVLPIEIGDGGGGFDEFLGRQGTPGMIDVLVGTIVLLLVLEACRRTTGLALPIVCVLAIGYAYYGGYLPQGAAIAHAGVDWEQIVSSSFLQSTGLYGVPLDVAATYIVLFTIYGAVLEASGASRFFINLSFAAFRKSRAAPGRTVTLAGFLLGSVSGSGTATAVSLGTVAWPVLRKAGYPKENAGGMLAAAGIGAILSPPTLGAAAFIIAEYLGVPYLTVLVWAIVPTLLYYLGILLAVEIDARRYGTREVEVATTSAWRLLARFGYHLASLVLIVVLLAMDVSAVRAVVYATVAAILLSFLDREHRLTPARLYSALATGVRGVLSVAAMITRTGLGLQLNSILVNTARSIAENPTAVLILTAIFAALAVSVLGLAVPVTASFVIAWVIIGPALQDLGVAAPAVAMFVFYFAVLSEVTPPTALASVAASAITGGRVIATMMQAFKYALPAFLVPFAFVLTENGQGLIGLRSFTDAVWTMAVVALGVVALAVLTGGWMVRRAGWPERALCAPAAALLLYLQPLTIAVGAGLLVLALALNLGLARFRGDEAQSLSATPGT
ncbi:TRAP transporter permease [Mycolicibacterium smegmatis]|uniref:TRAP transporter permease n=1 Tax=Mycolicibacterium smegmatis TaxID=1772 RepID=UPI001EFAAC4A|nr:TRAP transporter fused permease subunit [Mycolicibacterium smegmatis]ULN71327.1 TRAP transporter fused permease subunit [Mycolicibacterium smegmatis]